MKIDVTTILLISVDVEAAKVLAKIFGEIAQSQPNFDDAARCHADVLRMRVAQREGDSASAQLRRESVPYFDFFCTEGLWAEVIARKANL